MTKTVAKKDGLKKIRADPKRPSILILEVKGGQVEQRGGCWYQNGKMMKIATLDHALNFRRRAKVLE